VFGISCVGRCNRKTFFIAHAPVYVIGMIIFLVTLADHSSKSLSQAIQNALPIAEAKATPGLITYNVNTTIKENISGQNIVHVNDTEEFDGKKVGRMVGEMRNIATTKLPESQNEQASPVATNESHAPEDLITMLGALYSCCRSYT